MDSINHLRRVIREVLSPYTERVYAYDEIQNHLVWDEVNDQYLVLSMGWGTKPMKRRIHGCLIHLAIRDEKIWIQRDGTEEGVASELEAAGVSPQQIVLGFKEPELRPHTGYAAA